MRSFHPSMLAMDYYVHNKRKPDFENLLKVLRKERPARPTLFEFFLNGPLHKQLVFEGGALAPDTLAEHRMMVHAFKNAGYDYTTVEGSAFHFPTNRHPKGGHQTISLNDGAVITGWKGFEAYQWPDPEDYDYSILKQLSDELPDGMKLVVWGPGGILENVIDLMGYEALCYMLADDPELVQCVFDEVGKRFIRYYEICAAYTSVGALISNDDWGFKTQTMLSVKDMQRYVVPWHKRIVEVIHAAGKPAILHSCGNLAQVMQDIVGVIGYDAKHSYEDNILPVEEAYDQWSDSIAVLGGIDVDFLCRSTPEEVYHRSLSMLVKTMEKGSYALGSGNSIPEYVPIDNYLAMLAAVHFFDE